MIRFHLLFTFLLLSTLVFSQKSKDAVRIGFYNVENLFDLEDDPNTLDDDFTPTGRQKWTEDRYQTKLDRIGEVVEGMGFPTLLGLSEVENEQVCVDLAASSRMKKSGYQVVHFDSPDKRGIDVALLYQKKQFKVLEKETIRINFPSEVIPDEPDYTTRDVLVVKGILGKKETVHVLVAHMPSRRGGLQASEPKRLYVASQIRAKVDEIYAENPNANIVLMGDMNDETDNKSIAETIDAQQLTLRPAASQLYNCFAALDEKGLGSYNYRGNWNMLDQVILSSSFFDEKSKLKFADATIYQQEKMMYQDKKFGAKPNRTYGGPNYYGGYSDHLPVFVELRR